MDYCGSVPAMGNSSPRCRESQLPVLVTSMPLLPHGKFLHCVENTNAVLAHNDCTINSDGGAKTKKSKRVSIEAGGRLCNDLEKLIETETDCLRFDGEHLADFNSRRRLLRLFGNLTELKKSNRKKKET